jgi:hypothetical protein
VTGRLQKAMTMDPDKRYPNIPNISAGTIIGWCVAAAGIGQVPMIVAGLLTARVLPQAGLVLLLLGLPSGLLLFVGGLGLIYRQFAGYYCVYLATFFAGIGGFKSPYIPFIKRFVNFGPATEDLFLALNLVLVAILAWEHWGRLRNLEAARQKRHRTWLLVLMALGLCSVSIGRAMIHRESGEKSTPAELPSSERLSQVFKLLERLRTSASRPGFRTESAPFFPAPQPNRPFWRWLRRTISNAWTRQRRRKNSCRRCEPGT